MTGNARGRTVALGGGRRVPYPAPTSPAATRIGKANRKRNTAPEVRLRSELHRRGLRFRKDLLIRTSAGPKVRPDVVFTKARVAVFVDGCFWHGCPDHGTVPRRNTEYWGPKLDRNIERDHRANETLEAEGWLVLRVWEHEGSEAAERVVKAVRARPERR
jgi:DNA mismatch endonuclease (patch repair protein)